MANSITLQIKAQDDGSIVLQKFATTAQDTFQKVEKTSGNMVAGIKRTWVELTVAAGAAGLAINRAWGLAEAAAQFQEQKASLNALAAQYGTSANKIISGIQTISQGLVSMSDAADIAGSAMVKGLSPDQIIKLAGAAETLSNVTGHKVVDAFRLMAEGIGKGQMRGIEAAVGIIDLKDKYGDLVEKMSEVEKAQAMYTIIIERINALNKTLGESTDTVADKMERLTVQIADLKLQAGAFVIKGGLALYGIFQGTAAAALYLTSGVFGIIAALSALSDKLGLTSGGFEKWRAEADAALAASEELAKKGKDNLAAIFAAPGDLAGAAGKAGGRPAPGGGGGGRKDASEELAFIKSLNSEILQAKQQHQEAWLALAIEYNAKEVEAKKLGKNALLTLETWYSEQAAALMRKDSEDAIKEAERRHEKELELLFDSNKALADYYQKLADAQAKEERPGSAMVQATQDINSAPQAIGAAAQALGLAAAPLVAGALNLVQAVVNLPGMITDFVKGIVKAALDFPAKMVELITDVVGQLPNLLTQIVTKLIAGIPKFITALLEAIPQFMNGLANMVPMFIRAIIRAIPQVVDALIKGIPKMISALADGLLNMVNLLLDTLFGWIPGVSFGSQEAAAPAWADENTQAMKDLTDSIQSLNDSINKQLTDLLTGSSSPASAIERLNTAWGEVSKFKEQFASASGQDKVEAGKSLQDALSTYLKVAQEAYQRPSTEYQQIFDTTVSALKNIQSGLAGISTATTGGSGQSAWAGWGNVDILGGITGAFQGIWDGVVGFFTDLPGKLLQVFTDAWEGLKKIFTDAWDGLKNIFNRFAKALTDLPGKIWEGIKGIMDLPGKIWEGIKGIMDLPGKIWEEIKGIMDLPGKIFEEIAKVFKDLPGIIADAIKGALGGGDDGNFAQNTGDYINTHLGGNEVAGFFEGINNDLGNPFHHGGMIQKAHTGLFIRGGLQPYEVPIIAKYGEGVLNDYNGMKAIGGEAGLNYANKTGNLLGRGLINQTPTYTIAPQITINTKGEVDPSSIVRQTVRAIEDSLKYGKMRQMVNA